MTQTPPISNAKLIYQCILDLTNTNRAATRQVISNMTGLKMTIVDDHVKRMKDDGKLISPVNGVFEPVEDAPVDRAVSITYLSNGRVKLEIGDDCLDLTMREASNVGAATAGAGLKFGR